MRDYLRALFYFTLPVRDILFFPIDYFVFCHGELVSGAAFSCFFNMVLQAYIENLRFGTDTSTIKL